MPESDSAINFCIKHYERNNDKRHLAEAYYYKGMLLADMGDNNGSILYLKKAETIGQDIDNPQLRFMTHLNLAYVNAEEKAYHKREGQIIGQPVQSRENVGMDQKIVYGPQNGPESGEQGTDKALDVAPHFTVIPETQLHKLQAEDTGYVFYSGHADRHAQEHQQSPANCGVHAAYLPHMGQQIEYAQAETVQ